MNDEAADALLKDLEEPPAYAVIVLVADNLGAIPETIRSRCQLVPFTRLSERAMREIISARAPMLAEREALALARSSGGRLDRLERLLDPQASGAPYDLAQAGALGLLRAGVRSLGGGSGAPRVHTAAGSRGPSPRGGPRCSCASSRRAKPSNAFAEPSEAPSRRSSLRSSRELASWYRDLIVVAVGAERSVRHLDLVETLRGDATRERLLAAELAVEAVLRDVAATRGVQPHASACTPGAAFVRLAARGKRR